MFICLMSINGGNGIVSSPIYSYNYYALSESSKNLFNFFFAF